MTKLCKNCGKTFDTPVVGKDYCNLTCRETGKRRRRKHREITTAVAGGEQRQILVNPSTEQLTGLAVAILSGALVDGMLVKGVVPMWTPPAGIQFVEQIGTDVPTYLMVAGEPEPSIYDLLKV